MADHLSRYLSEDYPEVVPNYRQLQRIALNEVLKLSKDAVAPVQEQIESRFRLAKNQTDSSFQQQRQEVEADFQDSKSKLDQNNRQRTETFKTKHQTALNVLENKTQTTTDKIAIDAEARNRKYKKQLEYELIMADTVKDGALKKCQQERLETKTGMAKTRQYLQSLHDNTELILERYHFSTGQDEQPPLPPEPTEQDPAEAFRDQLATTRQHLERLSLLRLPGLFVDSSPYVLSFLICLTTVGSTLIWCQIQNLDLSTLLVSGSTVLGATLCALLFIGLKLRKKGKVQTQEVYTAIKQAMANVSAALELRLKNALEELDNRKTEAVENHQTEVNKACGQHESGVTESNEKRQELLKKISAEHNSEQEKIIQQEQDQYEIIKQEYQASLRQLQQTHDKSLAAINHSFQQQRQDYQQKYDFAYEQLTERWQRGLTCIEALMKQTSKLDNALLIDWSDNSWQQWQPGGTFSSFVRFGRIDLDMNLLADAVIEQAKFDIDPKTRFSLPGLLTFPDFCSLLLHSQRAGRNRAIDTLRSVMTHLFTSIPPGRINFTIMDPVGLGENFAGFMHAGDYQESLVGGRIWTSPIHIQQQLENITDHMENVIQKYLRNEFETIEEYNRQAGELAEPYRFLVIADFPINFNEESIRKLSSIITSGKRCGVYTLIAYDDRQELPRGLDMDDIISNSIYLKYEDDRFIWQDSVLKKFPLVLDKPPADELLTRIMHQVGKASRESSRVEVPFEIITPSPEQLWSSNNDHELSVPVGRTGASRLQHLKLGKGVAQHILIAGKTGSGKSTFFHVLTTNLALWYSPDQVELYMIDFKKGVEFKAYVTHKLPHARSIAIESDREFGLSILQRIDTEMTHRGNLFRHQGVQELASYRQASGKMLPRIVLIVDEFQVFFSEDDKLAQDASLLIEQLVRQGRAFGIHVILGSQTLGGSSSLARSTIGQMAVRIAMQCSEGDSQLILDDDNTAARLLSRPGEAIYNDAGGMVTGNSPFQTAWLSDTTRDKYLNQISDLSRSRKTKETPLIVFEGNVPADITENQPLKQLLEEYNNTLPDQPPRAWLGEPVAIKEPTNIVFRRQSGAHLLITGQNEQAALGVMTSAMTSLAAWQSSSPARFIILDGSSADSPFARKMPIGSEFLNALVTE